MAIHDPVYLHNHIRRAYKGNYRAHGDPASAECVIGVGFGYRKVNEASVPGLSNEDIAKMVKQFEYLPKMLEREVARAYRTLSTVSHTSFIEYFNPQQQLSIEELIRAFKDTMRNSYWDKALLIAHPNHVPWVDYLCGEIGINTIVPTGLEHIRFDPESVIPWTRSLAQWQHELIKRKSPDHNSALRIPSIVT